MDLRCPHAAWPHRQSGRTADTVVRSLKEGDKQSAPLGVTILTQVGGQKQRLASITIRQCTDKETTECRHNALNNLNGKENACRIWLHLLLDSFGLIGCIFGAQQLADRIRITETRGAALVDDLRFEHSS